MCNGSVYLCTMAKVKTREVALESIDNVVVRSWKLRHVTSR